MADSFFSLTEQDRREALEYGRAKTGRPAHLLEKDIWVVWALGAIFRSSLAADLTFKGGTSLSKVYKVIDRFSEDLDLTYNIRKLIPDLIGQHSDLPASRSQASKWTQAVRHRLPERREPDHAASDQSSARTDRSGLPIHLQRHP
ncbi:MAG: nucleotidyl transferase AbiEii/AbiGii toxin family protein [Castellaniella sp.]|uniref:nucleotidyl transferase AbiEii/AbiGii toxin family protein n=1 Tax=Castellaniella sp. TaxID=1955812 RepID=UPI003C7106BA